jgi:hypothetical protein
MIAQKFTEAGDKSPNERAHASRITGSDLTKEFKSTVIWTTPFLPTLSTLWMRHT